ncbi:hypothetical protein SCLCIDRAFT_1206954 [Scleroderma citrinum Foug A]|uniref:Uncharacterized protein n=1 Tax=Scleroderma citrinum Foug A TaxID=1036808 RepID=A0A0C3B0L8_9AGAM|nr:hypothetical protein SCLCIDRAFT_1206954 [Scleroderma citrinum Foug A]
MHLAGCLNVADFISSSRASTDPVTPGPTCPPSFTCHRSFAFGATYLPWGSNGPTFDDYVKRERIALISMIPGPRLPVAT